MGGAVPCARWQYGRLYYSWSPLECLSNEVAASTKRLRDLKFQTTYAVRTKVTVGAASLTSPVAHFSTLSRAEDFAKRAAAAVVEGRTLARRMGQASDAATVQELCSSVEWLSHQVAEARENLRSAHGVIQTQAAAVAAAQQTAANATRTCACCGGSDTNLNNSNVRARL